MEEIIKASCDHEVPCRCQRRCLRACRSAISLRPSQRPSAPPDGRGFSPDQAARPPSVFLDRLAVNIVHGPRASTTELVRAMMGAWTAPSDRRAVDGASPFWNAVRAHGGNDHGVGTRLQVLPSFTAIDSSSLISRMPRGAAPSAVGQSPRARSGLEAMGQRVHAGGGDDLGWQADGGAGSSMTMRGLRLRWKISFFFSMSSLVVTPTRPTSDQCQRSSAPR